MSQTEELVRQLIMPSIRRLIEHEIIKAVDEIQGEWDTEYDFIPLRRVFEEVAG